MTTPCGCCARPAAASWCCSNAPAPTPPRPLNTNLRTIPVLAETFGCPIGLSDHTMGVGASVAAVALGACVIEKHFTLSRAEGGVDSAFSLEPQELKLLVDETARAHQALGTVQLVRAGRRGEKPRSTSAASTWRSPLPRAKRLPPTTCELSAPATACWPRHWDVVLGRRATRALAPGTPLTWDALLGERRAAAVSRSLAARLRDILQLRFTDVICGRCRPRRWPASRPPTRSSAWRG
ncbi:MAG: N-acetylneuraminate synthase family protein [Hymenobacter sp.]